MPRLSLLFALLLLAPGLAVSSERSPPHAPLADDEEDDDPRFEKDEDEDEDEDDEDEDDEDEDDRDDGERKRKKTVIGDLTSPWFHVGGGVGAASDTSNAAFGGRFTLGGGFYTIMFASGGGLEVSGNALLPLSVHGVLTLGIAIPIPVFHPIFAFKGGGGFALHSSAGLTPELTLGGQAGFILRAFDGKPGFRLMVEPAYLLSPWYGAGAEVYVTFAAVF